MHFPMDLKQRRNRKEMQPGGSVCIMGSCTGGHNRKEEIAYSIKKTQLRRLNVCLNMVTSIKFDVASLTVHRHGIFLRNTVVEPKKKSHYREQELKVLTLPFMIVYCFDTI